jgi:hypothetical protein
MACDKAPGHQSGISTEMIKNLPPQAINLYLDFIQEFWPDKDIDFSLWHTAVLNTLYKGKGDHHDLNNHRGMT